MSYEAQAAWIRAQFQLPHDVDPKWTLQATGDGAELKITFRTIISDVQVDDFLGR